MRQTWFGVACCPPNITRTLASLGQYLYFKEDNEIYVNLFVANRTRTVIRQTPVELELSGDFPWENRLRFFIRAEKRTETVLAFRIPSYAQNFKILMNGREAQVQVKNSYARVSGAFLEEELEITFDAPAAFVRANPRVRADAGKMALVKGPLVYCLEETDNGDNLAAVLADSRQRLEAEYEEDLFGGSQTLRLTGKRISQAGWDDKTLYAPAAPVLEEEPLKWWLPQSHWL